MDKKELNEFGKKIKSVSSASAEEIKRIAEKANVDIYAALEEVYKIYQEPYMGGLNEESKILTAIRIYKTRLVKQLLSTAIPYKIYVVDKTGIAKFMDKTTGKERKVARVYGVAKPEIPDAAVHKYFVASVMLFDDKADVANKLSRKKFYKMKLSGNFKNNVFTLYSDVNTDAEPADAENIDVESVIKSTFPQKTIMELHELPSDTMAYCRVSVVSARTGMSKDRKWGMYLCVDDSMSMDDIRNTGALSVFMDADQVRYASESEIGIVGTVQKTQDGAFSFRGLFVVPILVFEATEQQPQQTTQEHHKDTKGVADLMDDSEIF